MNTPELSAGRGGGLSQGLPANGPYRSLFRAGSQARSESRAGANNHNHKVNAVAEAVPALHVLAEVAQSPEALSPVSTTISPHPTPTPAPAHAPPSVPASKKRSRKPSPLIASASPTSSVAPLDPIAGARPSPVASTKASSSSSQSQVIIDPSPPPRLPRAEQGGRGGGSTTGKGKEREKVPPSAPAAQANGNGEGSEQRHERGSLLPGRQLSGSLFPPSAEFHETEYVMRDRPRNAQKNKTGAASSREVEVGNLPRAPHAAADDGSYDHMECDYYPSYYDTGPSGASDIVREGGQSLSPPQAVVNHYPASARVTTSKESSPALMANSRSVTPGTKPRMITLLIEDRRHGTDELAEVHVPLKAAGEGHLWADAKEVCVALQTGPSRIDGEYFWAHAPLLKIKLIDPLSLLLRTRQGVHDAWKVSTDISARIC